MGHSVTWRVVLVVILVIFATEVQAQDRPLDLALRTVYSKHDTILSLQSAAAFRTYSDLGPQMKERGIASFHGYNTGQSLADVWCKTVTRMVYSNSKHPGYGDRVNQENDGVAFKCRFDDEDPIFVTMAGLTNSQKGVTFAVSIGKQFDMFEVRVAHVQVKGYVGTSLTAMSYEIPHKHKEYFLAIPMAHRGVSVSFSGLCTVGWEEEILPVDRIRLRSWNLRCEKRVNLF